MSNDMSGSGRALRVLRVAYTGRPEHSMHRRVTQGVLVGLVTLGAFGAAVSPDTEKAASSSTAAREPVAAETTAAPRAFASLPPAAEPTAVETSPAARPTTPAPEPTTARPVATATRPVAKTTTAPPKKAVAPPAARPACGAPANPWGYNFCGRGSYISSPPADFCSYFACIDSFWESTNGYVMQCDDGMYSHSGGRRGSCSHHGGNDRPLFG